MFLNIVGTVIRVNYNNNNQEKQVLIYLYKHDVHSELALPIKNNYIHWDMVFPKINCLQQDTNHNYISVGIGNREFYIHTPQWSDLSIILAIKALAGRHKSAMHISYCNKINLTTKNNYFPMYISQKNYNKLCDQITNQLYFDKKTIVIHCKSFEKYDAFYETHIPYHLFFTCNNFTNNLLKTAEVETCLYSNFTWGIGK